MAGVSRTRRLAKWLGTLLCLVIVAAFLYSTRRAVTWDSPGLRHEVGLMSGSVVYAWRIEGWRLEDEKYLPTPGWSVASYGGSPKPHWWIEGENLGSWPWLAVPLWMPLAVFAIPTAALWYRDRRSIPEAFRRLTIWMTPKRPKKVTFWRVVLLCVLHAATVVCGLVIFEMVYYFFVDYRSSDSVCPTVDLLALTLFWSTPLWGLMWAWLWTRYQNRLYAQQPVPHCLTCGYDLTGNVSGRCPECGDAICRQS